ncbi:MAG: DNA gyrase subunit A [Candidatus Cryptobacteroides sp.]|nr:DNA gyrase subunit A [Bacteroidales bacterium]MDY2707156.1 DNA gyrase subunit A [Candidatus Cryptobacteroides sp.]MDY2858707.1 DNA gyrase subunit A [Candidatus Cryptobacteroides sp.]MDY4630946.1 DNA gyrase subunit A [Candidatus Cryptobacteroides sp.]MDY5743951.1 DNA gyrase subunit A [Candidatus Cryptobacteroides sp.]
MDENNNIHDPELEVESAPVGRIEQVNIDQQMRSAYIDYSMSVIVSRALPDVRDGMKPVQRRVLYGMERLNLDYSAATMKSAGIVGEVMGKYHPHGDSSIYDTMVRLAQDWNLRYPLVKGQGNFGSMDGYSAAAMRYTEAKLEKISEAVLADLDKNTVDMVKNFDERFDEPTVLPTKVPLLLINGSSGIAVGMATNMAPHNLSECCDAICAYIDNPEIDLDGLMEHIKGPDFPTGGIIQGYSGIREAFANGRGRIVIRSKTDIELAANGTETIVITEVPYMVNKKEMIKKIADLVEDKKIEGIAEINDFTNRKGIRIAIRLKKGANSGVILNQLFKMSPLQSSFSVNNVAIVNGRPCTLNLKDLIRNFVSHRHEVILRRTRFDLEKARARAHILEGLLKALDIIDRIIEIIRGSRSVEEAKSELMNSFGFSDLQASAIVEMKLRQLVGLEREKLQAEYDELRKFILYCEDILGSYERQMEVIKEETMEMKEKYGDARRTAIVPDEGEFNPEDFYADEDVVITISHLGYIKRTALSEYRTQARGGKGMKGSATREEDFIEHIYVANMHSTMLFFTQNGKCYRLKVYEIPEGTRASKGRPVQNVISIEPGDIIKTYVNAKSIESEEYCNSHFVLLATRKGIVKKTALSEYSNRRSRNKGINAITVREGDELLDAILTTGDSQVLLAARNGRCVRFDEEDARPLGRAASGVRGISLDEDDEVMSVVCYTPGSGDAASQTALVVSEHGFGKRTDFEEYRLTSRGGKGVRTLNITEKTGKVVALKNVTEDNDLMIITRAGLTIRMSVSDIRQAGRATQGVKLINIKDSDLIASVTVVPKQEEAEDQQEEQAE